MEDLIKRYNTDPIKSSNIRMKALVTDSEIIYPEPLYGESPILFQDFPGAGDKCLPGPMQFVSPLVYMIKDCTVWSKYGLIFVDNYLIRESIYHFPDFLMPEISFEGEKYRETSATLTIDIAKEHTLDHAITTLAGIQGNYYHWLMFALSPFNAAIINAWKENQPKNQIVLIPDGLNQYQETSINILLNSFQLQSFSASEKEFVDVKNLIFPRVFRQGGVTPHPIIKESLSILKEKLQLNVLQKRKIYISRKDTNNRKLENEDEIVAYLKVVGFEVVSLTGMALEDQISLFAATTHIVAAHGAGLTNIVFCQPGTKILEIHMDSYVNWCYRRLCALYELEYGFIYGEREKADHSHIHALSFTLPLFKLEDVLCSSSFLNGPFERLHSKDEDLSLLN